MKQKLKDETYKGIRIKFFYDGDFVVAQPYGFRVYNKANNKEDAFIDVKRRINYEMERGEMVSIKKM